MHNVFYYENRCYVARSLCMTALVIAVMLVLSAFQTATFAASNDLARVKIMPLGNSITCDNNRDQTPPVELKEAYRSHLYYKLTQTGYSVDFVGSRNDGYGVVPAFDSDHEGWPGWTVAEIRDHIYNWLIVNTADIILLHIGTNGSNWAQKPAEVDGLLDEIDRFETDYFHPIVTILAKIIQKLPSDPNVTEYNQKIEELAKRRISEGDKIIVVDMPAAGLTDVDMYDNLHPSKSGYVKMADVWYEALVPLLDLGVYVSFSAETQYITADQTTTLRWEVNGKQLAGVVLNGEPVASKGTLEVGPDETTVYILTGETVDGMEFEKSLTVNVVDINSVHIRLNSWGPATDGLSGDIVADDGTVWKSSLPYLSSGGKFFDFSSTVEENDPVNYDQLINPAPKEAYFSVTRTNHSYNIPMLPNGVYTLRLHFFDTFGSRAMDYFVEGQKVLEGLNTTVSNATIVEFPVEITDNNGLQIVADVGTGNDVFESAIEIIGSPDASPSVQFATRSQNSFEGIREALVLLHSLSENVGKKIEHAGLQNSVLAKIASAEYYAKSSQLEQSINTLNRLIKYIKTKWITQLIDNQTIQLELIDAIEDCIAAVTDNVSVTAVLSHVTTSDVTVQLQVQGTAGLADHTLGEGPVELIIRAGEKEGSIAFKVVDDTEAELNETIILTMNSPVNAMMLQQSSMNTHTITIMEDDSKMAGISIDPVGRLIAGDTLSATVFDQLGRAYEGDDCGSAVWEVNGAEYLQINNLAIVFTKATPVPAVVTVTMGWATDTKTVELLGDDAIWIRVNSGGKDVLDPKGNVWEEDTPYLVSGFEGSAYTSNAFNKEKILDGLIDAAPQEVYTTVRHRYQKGTQLLKKIFVPVPDGNYTVRIHFADATNSERLMSYWINDVRVLEGFDPAFATEYGASGVSIKEFRVSVSGGIGISITSEGGAPLYYDSFEAAYEVITNILP